MGIFDKIKDAIWGSEDEGTAEPPKPQLNPAPTQTASAGSSAPTPTASPVPPPTAQAEPAPSETAQAPSVSPSPSTQPGSGPAAVGTVDVAAVMDAAVKKKGQKLDWRHSIVDMMKALDLDSDLAARKELADELGYTGDKSDSAKMNVWLHKALMQKLAENGGKVPGELRD